MVNETHQVNQGREPVFETSLYVRETPVQCSVRVVSESGFGSFVQGLVAPFMVW